MTNKIKKKKKYTPLRSQIHVDTLLSNVSVLYRNESYIGMEIFPEVQVKKTSDLFRVYERNFRTPESLRANRGVANEWTFNVSNSTYNLEKHALKDYISDDDAENYDLNSLEVDTTEHLTDAILRRFEKSVASLITTTSWSLNLSLTSTLAWNATTGSSSPDPVAQFDTATVSVVTNSGKRPNITGMGLTAWNALKNNFQINDRVKYTSSEVSMNMVAKLIGTGKLVVSEQVEDTADEGSSTGSNIVALWNDRVFHGYRPPNAGPKQPSAGYTFRKSTPMVKKWRDEDRESQVVEVGMMYQPRVVASLCGFIIADVY